MQSLGGASGISASFRVTLGQLELVRLVPRFFVAPPVAVGSPLLMDQLGVCVDQLVDQLYAG